MKKGRPSTSYKRSEKKRNLTQNVLRKKKGGNVQINNEFDDYCHGCFVSFSHNRTFEISNVSNSIIECKTCRVKVHLSCYGNETFFEENEGKFLFECDVCKNNYSITKIVCVICNNGSEFCKAFKHLSPNSKSYAHLACCFFSPEITLNSYVPLSFTYTPISSDNVSNCYICLQKSNVQNIFPCFLCKKKKAHIICIFIEKILNPNHQESWWTTSLFLNDNKSFEQKFRRKIENKFSAEINHILDKCDEKINNFNENHYLEKEDNQNDNNRKDNDDSSDNSEIKQDSVNILSSGQKSDSLNDNAKTEFKDGRSKISLEENYDAKNRSSGILNENSNSHVDNNDENKKQEFFRIFGICEQNYEENDSSIGKGGVIQFVCGDHDFEEKCYCGRDDKIEDKMIACDYCNKWFHMSCSKSSSTTDFLCQNCTHWISMKSSFPTISFLEFIAFLKTCENYLPALEIIDLMQIIEKKIINEISNRNECFINEKIFNDFISFMQRVPFSLGERIFDFTYNAYKAAHLEKQLDDLRLECCLNEDNEFIEESLNLNIIKIEDLLKLKLNLSEILNHIPYQLSDKIENNLNNLTLLTNYQKILQAYFKNHQNISIIYQPDEYEDNIQVFPFKEFEFLKDKNEEFSNCLSNLRKLIEPKKMALTNFLDNFGNVIINDPAILNNYSDQFYQLMPNEEDIQYINQELRKFNLNNDCKLSVYPEITKAINKLSEFLTWKKNLFLFESVRSDLKNDLFSLLFPKQRTKKRKEPLQYFLTAQLNLSANHVLKTPSFEVNLTSILSLKNLSNLISEGIKLNLKRNRPIMQKIKALKDSYIKAKFLNDFCLQTLQNRDKLENNKIKQKFEQINTTSEVNEDSFANDIYFETQTKKDNFGENKIIGVQDFKKLFRESNIFLSALKNFWIEKKENRIGDKKQGLEFVQQSIERYLIKKDIKIEDLHVLQSYHEAFRKDIEESLPFESNILSTLLQLRKYIIFLKNSTKIIIPHSSFLSFFPTLLSPLSSLFSSLLPPSSSFLPPSSSLLPPSSSLPTPSSPLLPTLFHHPLFSLASHFPPKMSPFYPEAINLFLFEFHLQIWLEKLNFLKIKPISYKFFFILALDWDELERKINENDEKPSQSNNPNHLEKIKLDPLIINQITNFKNTRLNIELLLIFEKQLDFHQTSQAPIHNPSEFSAILHKNEGICIEIGIDLPSLRTKLNFFKNITTAAVKAEKLMSLFSMKSRQLNIDFFLVLNRFALKYELYQIFPVFSQIRNVILKANRIKSIIKKLGFASRKKEKEFNSKKIGLPEKRKILEKLEDGLLLDPRLFFYEEIYEFFQKMPDHATIMEAIADLEELNLNLTFEKKALITFKKSTEVFGRLFESFEEDFSLEKVGGSLFEELLSDLVDIKNKMVSSTLLNCAGILKMREIEIKLWSRILVDGSFCFVHGFFKPSVKKEINEEERENEKEDKVKNKKKVLQEIKGQMRCLKGEDNDNDNYCNGFFGMSDVSLALKIEKACQEGELKKEIRERIDYLEEIRGELSYNLNIYSEIQGKKEALLKKFENVVSINELEMTLTEIQELKRNLLTLESFNAFKSKYLENKFYEKEINSKLYQMINQKKVAQDSFIKLVDSIRSINLKKVNEFRNKLYTILFESYFNDTDAIPLKIEINMLSLFWIFFKLADSFHLKKSELKLNLMKRVSQIFPFQIESLKNLLKSVDAERTLLITQTAKLKNLETNKKPDKKQDLIETRFKILDNLETELKKKIRHTFLKEYKIIKKCLLAKKIKLIISAFKLEKKSTKKKWFSFNELKKLLQVKPDSILNRLFISKGTKKIKKGEKNENAMRKGTPLDSKRNNKDKNDYINLEFILFPNQKIKEIYVVRKKNILGKLKEILARLKRKTLIRKKKYRILKSMKVFNEIPCNEQKFLDVLIRNSEEIRNYMEKDDDF